ncbi:hypothetical protein M9Y10_018864 [Tritrichomonas musculus]|uniref:Fungal lipase-type domain-containing protein n=1 Tax=Tritrichomonas musculus TaxID=1915356 RepID=A0ABR2HK13_9EUKA
MFTNKEVRHYTQLLQILNQETNNQLPNGYSLVLKGGGKDGIPHFKLLFNSMSNIYVIWVRGTNFIDPNDVLINMRTRPILFYSGCCHNGYFIAANEIINLISGKLIIENATKIICLGHSLGGAVSSIIATILHKFNFEYNKTIQKVKSKNGIFAIIFGTPPTFSANICIETRKFITNIILKKDIVPKLGGMFTSLMHFQNKKVTNSLYQNNRIQNKQKNESISNNNENLNADYLPGKVFVIDNIENNFLIQDGQNKTEIKKYSDCLGIFHHSFNNYYNIIIKNIPNDDNIFYVQEQNYSLNKFCLGK